MPAACRMHHAGNTTGMSPAMHGERHGHECGLMWIECLVWHQLYWYSTFRLDTVAVSATLATGTPERRLQACDARSSVVVWHFTIVVIVPSQRPPSFLPVFASDDCTFHNVPNMHCKFVSCYVDTFDDRGFAAAGHGLWNCLPSHAKKAHFVQ